MPENNFITVTQLNNVIKRIFIAEEMLHNIVIVGEISGFKTSGDHAYFALKDENCAIQCNCFYYKKTYIPKEGEQILAKGTVDYYNKIGKLNFNISDIQPYGAGALAQMLEKLKLDLLKKGYFDESHKKPIPKFPKRVCVITSKTGAVIRDIIRTVREVNNKIDIVVRDVKVQGIGAEDDIVQAIREVDPMGFDSIIIARGGGSLEDLMPFNSEKIVYAIYDAITPIISSVGHETDTTLCDLAADIRVPTPTAAGELVAYNVDEYSNYFKHPEIVKTNPLVVDSAKLNAQRGAVIAGRGTKRYGARAGRATKRGAIKAYNKTKTGIKNQKTKLKTKRQEAKQKRQLKRAEKQAQKAKKQAEKAKQKLQDATENLNDLKLNQPREVDVIMIKEEPQVDYDFTPTKPRLREDNDSMFNDL